MSIYMQFTRSNGRVIKGDVTEAGHQVINVGWWPLYYVTGGPLTGLRAPEDQMYEDWMPFGVARSLSLAGDAVSGRA